MTAKLSEITYLASRNEDMFAVVVANLEELLDTLRTMYPNELQGRTEGST